MADALPETALTPDLLKAEARDAYQRIVEIGREVTERAPGLNAAMAVVAHHASTMWAEGKPTSQAHSALVLICSEITCDHFDEDVRFRMTEIIGQAAKIEALISEESGGPKRWSSRVLASILAIGCASAAACGFHVQSLAPVSPMGAEVVATNYGDFWTDAESEAIGPNFSWIDQVPIGSGYDAPIWAG